MVFVMSEFMMLVVYVVFVMSEVLMMLAGVCGVCDV